MSHLKVQVTELFHLDRGAVNLSKSTLGLAVVLVALILLSTIGAFGFTAAFGAVLAVAVDSGGSRRQRIVALSVFALAGALATLLGNGAGASMWGGITVVFAVTLVCGWALAFGPQIGKMAFMVNLWMAISLSLSTVLYEPVNLALGFFCGSAAVALLLLLSKGNSTDLVEADSPPNWSLAPLRAHLNPRSPIAHFALGRAFAAAVAMWLGWWLAPAHYYWIAMTILIVVVPDRQQAARTSWQRAIGTVIGVAVGAAVLALNLPAITLLLLWLLVTLVMLAVQAVNYALYASILTLNLILFYQLLEADVLFNGIERLITTLLGIAMSLGVIALLGHLETHTSHKPAAG